MPVRFFIKRSNMPAENIAPKIPNLHHLKKTSDNITMPLKSLLRQLFGFEK